METRPIRIGILEDQLVFRESLEAVLTSAGHQVVARGSDVEGFMAALHESVPDVVVADLRLEHPLHGEVADGLRVVELLHDFYPSVRSIILSGSREPEMVHRCLQAGAAGYLFKQSVGCAAVLEAVERVAQGERLLPPEVAGATPLPESRTQAPAGALERLTAREREVLGYIAAGADNLKIAAHLGITERTVKAHITSIYRKLGPENRTQMAVLACQLGIERPASV
jgi:DNA-binding NarL/FixJ family response regulator